VFDKLRTLKAHVWTEEDISFKLQKKRALAGGQSSMRISSAMQQRAQVIQARSLAVARRDNAEVAMLDEKLAELEAEYPSASPAASPDRAQALESSQDKLAKLNERNRRANQEEVRRAEIRAAERKRQAVKSLAETSSKLKTSFTNGASPVKGNAVAASAMAATPNGKPASRFEEMVANQVAVEVDLGDF